MQDDWRWPAMNVLMLVAAWLVYGWQDYSAWKGLDDDDRD